MSTRWDSLLNLLKGWEWLFLSLQSTFYNNALLRMLLLHMLRPEEKIPNQKVLRRVHGICLEQIGCICFFHSLHLRGERWYFSYPNIRLQQTEFVESSVVGLLLIEMVKLYPDYNIAEYEQELVLWKIEKLPSYWYLNSGERVLT